MTTAVSTPSSYLYDPVTDAPRLARQAQSIAERARPVLGPSATSSGRPRRVLDVGCAGAQLTQLLFGELGSDDVVVGVDRNASALEAARTRMPEATFLCAAVDAIPTLDLAPFDLVFSSLVLQHLDSPAQGVRQLWEMVAPGGTLSVLWPDDRFKIATPENPAIRELFSVHELPGVSKRFASEEIIAALYSLDDASVTTGGLMDDPRDATAAATSFEWRLERIAANRPERFEYLADAAHEFCLDIASGRAALYGATPWARVTKHA
jgi:SAM-dependent methyltransferase